METRTTQRTTTYRSSSTAENRGGLSGGLSSGNLASVGNLANSTNLGGSGSLPGHFATISSRLVKPISNARTVIINRTAAAPQYSSGNTQRIVTMESSHRSGVNFVPGASTQALHADVGSLKHGRAKEKQELRELNERFANYIEKVRFLEAQNKKLANELGQLRDNWGKDTEKIKELYTVEMEQLRKLLNDAEKRNGEMEVQFTSMEDRMNEMQHQLDEAMDVHNKDKEIIDRLNQELANIDGELSLLRRRMAGVDEEKRRDKGEIQRLRDEIKRLRMDLDQETLNHINAENEAQTLRDELEFIKQVHATELKELAALAYRDTTQENRDFWKTEMSQALREIQNDYDQKMDIMRNDMETHYNLKVQEIRTIGNRENLEFNNLKEENVRIKTQISDMRNRLPDLEGRNAQLERLLEELRREMSEKDREYTYEMSHVRTELTENRSELESVLKEMQNLLDAKLSLELEIAAYRKLLESEENRLGLRGVMDSVITRTSGGSTMMSASGMGGGGGGGGGSSSMSELNMTSSGGGGMMHGNGSVGGGGYMNESSRLVTSSSIIKGEMSAKTTYQRTSKGNVTIQDCSPDGKFVSIENTGRKREDISGMRITRNTDSGRMVIRYTIPDKTFLDVDGRDKVIKIWARGCRPAGSNDLEMSDSTWGIGSNIVTILTNSDGDEKATHTQKTVYAS